MRGIYIYMHHPIQQHRITRMPRPYPSCTCGASIDLSPALIVFLSAAAVWNANSVGRGMASNTEERKLRSERERVENQLDSTCGACVEKCDETCTAVHQHKTTNMDPCIRTSHIHMSTSITTPCINMSRSPFFEIGCKCGMYGRIFDIGQHYKQA